MSARVLGGKYQLRQLLGRGGMGEVYEATHTSTGRRVAVKVLKQVASGDEDKADLVARFQREARATCRINSSHIVQVLDAGEDSETSEPFMVMEYLEGRDLNALVRELGPFPVDLALRATAQACMGLVKAHEAGVVHRDIKPANIYLTRAEAGKRTVKVLDFGIARMNVPRDDDGGGDTTSDLTRTGSMLGSPHYMAPEQVRGLKSVDARADVWSLGVVLYKLLCGKTPHDQGQGGMGELFITICCVPPPRIQERAPWVPPEVASVVHQALRIDPAQRYPSAQAMLEALLALLPDGTDIDESMVHALSDEDRAHEAPRATLEDFPSNQRTEKLSIPVFEEGVETRATSATDSAVALSSTATRTMPSRSKRRTTLAVVCGIALLGAGAGMLYVTRHPTPAVPVAATSAATAAPEPAPTPRPVVRNVPVYVVPGAIVEVDGAPVAHAEDGTVMLSGAVGSTHRVRAILGAREVSAVVAITENGAVPPVVVLEAQAQAPAQVASKPASPARTQAPRPSGAPRAAPAPAASKGTLVTAFE